ncbi:MAG: hypothetical protein R3310_02475 [Candidatus Competibacteraceae bacterium]|nr:hypothetical protein [Candidatus Competibacteraceae bacterium]
MSSDDYQEKYTKPQLRRRLKEEIKASDKGGKPGRWSARKSQLLVQEYEKQGGDYKKRHKDQAARSLEQWSKQDWQTQKGDSRARKDGTTHRYLPKQVWEMLSEQERQQAERSKQRADDRGEEVVRWPAAVKRAIKRLEDGQEPSKEELYKKAKQLDIRGRSKMNKAQLGRAVEEAEA